MIKGSTIFKVVISDPKTRKAWQKEIEHGASGLLGKKIGDTFPGENIGIAGYHFEITGGSDKDGFPMRFDVGGTGRKKALLSGPPCFYPKTGGQRKKRSVRGNVLSAEISQVNVKAIKEGPKPLEEMLGKKGEKKEEAPKGEEKREEKPKVEKKNEPKKEEKG